MMLSTTASSLEFGGVMTLATPARGHWSADVEISFLCSLILSTLPRLFLTITGSQVLNMSLTPNSDSADCKLVGCLGEARTVQGLQCQCSSSHSMTC